MTIGGSTERGSTRAQPVGERIPAHVVGDGVHTVAELIEIANQDPDQGGTIEVNAASGTRMHLFPSQGEPRDVGGAILRQCSKLREGKLSAQAWAMSGLTSL